MRKNKKSLIYFSCSCVCLCFYFFGATVDIDWLVTLERWQMFALIMLWISSVVAWFGFFGFAIAKFVE
jgi:hypothetical protein